MKEIWGKEIEKLIHKEVSFLDKIPYQYVAMVQDFCKNYIVVIIMQTYVRGGNDPETETTDDWDRAFFPG